MLTQADIFREIVSEKERQAEFGWTALEFGQMMKLKGARAREVIREGIKAGRIVRAGMCKRLNSQGMTIRVPAYLFTDAATKTQAGSRKKARPA